MKENKLYIISERQLDLLNDWLKHIDGGVRGVLAILTLLCIYLTFMGLFLLK